MASTPNARRSRNSRASNANLPRTQKSTVSNPLPTNQTEASDKHEILHLIRRCLNVSELNHAQIQRILTTPFSLNSPEIPMNFDDPHPVVRVRLDRIQDRQRIKEMSSVELGNKFAACGDIWQSITAIRHGQSGRILNIYAITWDVQKQMIARQAEITNILGVSNDCRVVNRDYLVKVMGLDHATNKNTMPDLTQHMAKCSRDHGVSIREAYWSKQKPVLSLDNPTDAVKLCSLKSISLAFQLAYPWQVLSTFLSQRFHAYDVN